MTTQEKAFAIAEREEITLLEMIESLEEYESELKKGQIKGLTGFLNLYQDLLEKMKELGHVLLVRDLSNLPCPELFELGICVPEILFQFPEFITHISQLTVNTTSVGNSLAKILTTKKRMA